MENSSHYQKRVIDKIYGKYGRGPLESLEDLCKLHLDYLHNEKDRLIISHFKKEVERNLSLHLASDKRFNNFDSFKENYLLETHNYVSNKCDELGWTGVDGIADLTKAYVGELIDQQKSIIDRSVKVYINVKDEEPLDVIQFVSDLFLDKHKFNARLKIDYLNEELNQLKGFPKQIEAVETPITEVSEVEKKDSNPYPLLFISSDTYHKFIEYISKHIQDFYKDYSYLKKRLEFERLIHNQTDTEFMRILHEELKLITEEEFEEYFEKGKLSSLGKSKAKERISNFNKIFMNI